MTNCQHNEVNSFHQRYLKETPPLGALDYDLINEIVDKLAVDLKPFFDGPITIGEFLRDKKGRLGKRYNDAYKDIFENCRSLRDISRMTAFIKLEKYNDETKSPRFIMGRDARFNLLYGLFTTAMEHAFTKLKQVAKGKNFLERGKQFADLIFGGWYLENDFSKFEGSQRLEVLVIEKMLFKKLLSATDYANYKALWQEKMFKRGYTKNGIKFQFQGCRGSGDMDTGLGNTLLNFVSLKYFMIKNGLDPERFIVDGDDSVAAIPKGREDFVNYFLDFGFDAKLLVKKTYHEVDFCSSKFIQVNPGTFYQVQNLDKLLTNIGTILDDRFVQSAAEYYASLGYMYQVVYKDIPIYYQLGCFLRNFIQGKHYAKPSMIESNYGIREAFKNSTTLTFEVDHKLAYLEVMLTSGKSAVELEYLCMQLSAKVVLPKNYTKEMSHRETKPTIPPQLVDPFKLVNIKERSRLKITQQQQWILDY